ncbi:MAG TPA: Sec-independent protein translocase protein TatB [Azospirillaceae bacterium]|nr:Sec-independent protein translocase protein TatB [Azospirillaceae bacterium]HRQ80623.1 Sec-independent protein translocase protein TatB [Azospirillaceae bacterium]
MFDIGWPELMLIGLVALVVIGPKDLPKAIYGFGKWVRKARVVAREFQTHIDDMMREAELDDLRQQALKARDLNMSRMMENAVDPKGELKGALDLPPAPKVDEPNIAAPNISAPNISAPPTPAETTSVAEPPPVQPQAAQTTSTPDKSA